MTTIDEILKNGILAQLVITIIVWTVLGYLYATGKPVDENLLHAGLLILGFFFRSAVAAQADK